MLREGKALTRLPVIPAPFDGMECCGTTKTGSIRVRGHAGEPGAMTRGDHAPWGVASASRRLRDGLGTDGAVPKAGVDEGDDLSRHGDPGDLAGTGAVAVVSGDADKVGS